ncbi:MAG TPA: hypothetical protein DIT04_10265 [Dysgonomonas sp.]|nr:hypothetical protein [Dysgonomonas sp.]
MSKKLPFFEEIIDWDDLEDYYETEVDFQGHEVSIDLNLDDEPEKTWAEDYAAFMNNMEQYHDSIRKMIKGYYNEDGLVKEFFTFHFEEADNEDARAELAASDKTLSDEDQKLSLLKLRRLGFYFAEDNFATWDFMFNPDYTDQILVVITDKKGEVLDMTWES